MAVIDGHSSRFDALRRTTLERHELRLRGGIGRTLRLYGEAVNLIMSEFYIEGRGAAATLCRLGG